MWISRAHSLDYPAEIKQNMTFAIETFAGKPGLKQTVRLEEDIVITDNYVYDMGTRIVTELLLEAEDLILGMPKNEVC